MLSHKLWMRLSSNPNALLIFSADFTHFLSVTQSIGVGAMSIRNDNREADNSGAGMNGRLGNVSSEYTSSVQGVPAAGGDVSFGGPTLKIAILSRFGKYFGRVMMQRLRDPVKICL
ncbi:MAG: hypothetical protein VYA34_15780 [Myxococcota bacterium]|nr:hypothetical protein [Myxococcota bacterium]